MVPLVLVSQSIVTWESEDSRESYLTVARGELLFVLHLVRKLLFHAQHVTGYPIKRYPRSGP
jgi:hypothetical protein